ncbi:aminotransferase class V-fold PLP-dependent enzyme [Phycicoccus sp. CSK15P-2]|uniref:aminotransferase class V-fold PLP-dependent enzyme n=1 Tax=Phycicoccus sp. CSK15P-2 TaxID=2807627 RepID=UPI00194F4418|nr:aminotransferase class V-fold PLP-dependent enzyme [Phycicoccus sp. CSK15P-2]MBM6406080.1 aminotransferase class V-fold PLP-dependent enzyme [Phycicoccus sp. CSK15P-2]
MDRREDYAVSPGKVFLNHGSFGATPLPVLQAARALRAEAESDYPAFWHERAFPLLDASRRAVCDYLGVPGSRGVFLRNSTTAMQTVVDHLTLREGDHVVTTSREYEATVVLMRRLAARGVVVETVDGRYAGLVERIIDAVGPRTRAVVVSHVTSPWSQVNEVEAIAEELSGRGVATVVDGAHTAGALTLPRPRPGVFTCLTLHKWLHMPKGTGFLVVPEDAVDDLRPVVTSWYAEADDLPSRFSWTGTDDVVPHLVGAEAVAYQRGLEGDGLTEHWRSLTALAEDLLLELPEVSTLPLAPRAPSMVAVRLHGLDPVSVLRRLHERNVDLWCGSTDEGPVLRLSVAPYTTAEDVEQGVDVLRDVMTGAAAA